MAAIAGSLEFTYSRSALNRRLLIATVGHAVGGAHSARPGGLRPIFYQAD